MGLFREVGVSNGSLYERLVPADSHPGIASSSPGLQGLPNGLIA